MDLNQLTAIARGIAADRTRWENLVPHEAKRAYAEIETDMVTANAWVIAWQNGHDTGFHDHGGSSGAVVVVRGTISEERFVLDDPHTIVRGRFRSGRSFHFGPRVVHRVHHETNGPAVTVHVYSPPLERMTSFDRDEDGRFVLRGHTKDEELRPLERLTLAKGDTL